MSRADKYKDTKTFHYHNANPKSKITSDCVIRAISTALEIDYNTVVRELAELQIKTGYDDGDAKCYGKYLESKGWYKHKQPRSVDGGKLTGHSFCNYISCNKRKDYGNILCHIGGHHIVAIIPTCSGDGYNDRFKVCDIWDSTGKCIGNYWTKHQEDIGDIFY